MPHVCSQQFPVLISAGWGGEDLCLITLQGLCCWLHFGLEFWGARQLEGVELPMTLSGCSLQRTRGYWHKYPMESSGCDLQKLQVRFRVILHQNKCGLLQCCLPSVYLGPADGQLVLGVRIQRIEPGRRQEKSGSPQQHLLKVLWGQNLTVIWWKRGNTEQKNCAAKFGRRKVGPRSCLC